MTHTEDTLRILAHEEEELIFESFTSRDALRPGNLLVELSAQYGREICADISRTEDGCTVFRYLGSTKTEANLGYARGKRRACLESGHASAYVYVSNQMTGAYQDMFDGFPGYCPTAGAFPVRVKGETAAVVSVSGLHDGMDHELIIRALEKMLGKDTGEYPSGLV